MSTKIKDIKRCEKFFDFDEVYVMLDNQIKFDITFGFYKKAIQITGKQANQISSFPTAYKVQLRNI